MVQVWLFSCLLNWVQWTWCSRWWHNKFYLTISDIFDMNFFSLWDSFFGKFSGKPTPLTFATASTLRVSTLWWVLCAHWINPDAVAYKPRDVNRTRQVLCDRLMAHGSKALREDSIPDSCGGLPPSKPVSQSRRSLIWFYCCSMRICHRTDFGPFYLCGYENFSILIRIDFTLNYLWQSLIYHLLIIMLALMFIDRPSYVKAWLVLFWYDLFGYFD